MPIRTQQAILAPMVGGLPQKPCWMRGRTDGVIVGSVLVNAMERLESESAIEISSQVSKLLSDMRSAMDRA